MTENEMQEEIEELQKAVINQNEQISKLQDDLQIALTTSSDLAHILSETQNTLSQVISNQTIEHFRLQNLPYEIFDERYHLPTFIPHIMTINKTIDEIVFNHKSISRFGDGEFDLMKGHARWRFQHADERLMYRLQEVITSNEENLLIGLNDFYGTFVHWTEVMADGARCYITPQTRLEHQKFLTPDRLYANALMSRGETKEHFANLKRIWDNQDCIFIEGCQTRMGIGNDLFDNCKSIQRILCPAESAFDRYDEILSEALKQSSDKLVLIALGPTASVLAYDLCQQGYWTIDLGHADMCYEWTLRNNGITTSIPTKYNNEAPDQKGYIVQEINDPLYDSQIIARIY